MAAGILAVGVATAVVVLTSISGLASPEGRTVQLLPTRGVLAMAENPNYALVVINLAGNVAVFVPLGVLFLLSFARTVPRATACGAGLSLSIEVLQFVGGSRSADVDDVLLNALGTFLGAALVRSVLAVAFLLRSRRVAAAAQAASGRHPAPSGGTPVSSGGTPVSSGRTEASSGSAGGSRSGRVPEGVVAVVDPPVG